MSITLLGRPPAPLPPLREVAADGPRAEPDGAAATGGAGDSIG